eukprot:gnl/MRDRNA2_/MRDRNA2_76018_c0_seq2.p1 gnl/MRDRNA2_/MRDRNA2_76018_c0~~gnl/MRDRNA2_/MRDRNA2_76018_c0_seq2.p1  ORF type:complete len:100 (-),score=18.91 gnl/MRDRNA2_/MRDRNA2_76018_c0_seq2:28-327(-)
MQIVIESVQVEASQFPTSKFVPMDAASHATWKSWLLQIDALDKQQITYLAELADRNAKLAQQTSTTDSLQGFVEWVQQMQKEKKKHRTITQACEAKGQD